jgi:hypothetical protein
VKPWGLDSGLKVMVIVLCDVNSYQAEICSDHAV